MFTLRLPNGQEFPMSYSILKELVENLPDENEYSSYCMVKVLAENIEDDTKYAELANALLGLGIPSITRMVIENITLTGEQYDRLWENGNRDVRRSLVAETAFLANLSDAQARDIIDANDPNMLRLIAKWAEKLYPDDEDAEQAARLSGEMADAVLEHICKHPDCRVRHALMGNSSAPDKFLPPVRVYIEESVTKFIPLAGMTREDMESLAHASLDTLEYLAENIEAIRDKRIRREVVKVLLAHPDPAIRLALVENTEAPEYAVKALLDDNDADIAATAKKELKRRELEDEFDEEEEN